MARVVSYAAATRRTQILRMARLARTALTAWGLADAELRLLHHGYNTTFSVVTDGARFALRINVQAHKEPTHLRAELAWLTALRADTNLLVPEPVPARDGDLFTLVPSPDHGRDLPVVLFDWLEGRLVGNKPPLTRLRTLGATTATLHRHAATWSLPAGATLPGLDTLLMNVPDRLSDGHPALPPGGQQVIVAAMERIARSLGAVFEREGPRPLHADLHGGNLKWHRGRLAVLDFDDAGLGVPIQDLAISAFYLRPSPRAEEALFEGYALVAPLPEVTGDTFEALVAWRNLVLANDLIATEHADFRTWVASYLPTTVARLRHYLDTGVFRPDAPGAEVF